MTTLTKNELIENVYTRFVVSHKEAQQIVDACFQEMSQTLEQDEIVKITHWGRFTVKNKTERPGRNPRTGEPMQVSARRVVTFHASSRVKARILNQTKKPST